MQTNDIEVNGGYFLQQIDPNLHDTVFKFYLVVQNYPCNLQWQQYMYTVQYRYRDPEKNFQIKDDILIHLSFSGF